MSTTLDGASYGDAQYRNAQYNYTIKWGLTGFTVGALGVGYPILWLAGRRFPAVQRAHPSVRFSFLLSSACAGGVIAADKAGIRFDRERRTDAGAAIVAQSQTEEERIWNSLTSSQKTLTFLKENKISAVTTGLLSSIALITLYLQTTPMTGAQKLVQARVWGQSLTLASIIGFAALSQISTPGDAIEKLRESESQHSWIASLELEQPELKGVLSGDKDKKKAAPQQQQ